MHIVIDGYNLIRQSDRLSLFDLQDIQLGREALIDALADYKRVKRHRITVVFDGTDAVGFDRHRDRVKGIDIRFSRGGETADTVIKRMAVREGQKIVVVSSDRAVATFSSSQGASTIGSLEFEDKLALAGFMSGTAETEDEAAGWVPTTRKKGPKKRLSKKARRQRMLTRKL